MTYFSIWIQAQRFALRSFCRRTTTTAAFMLLVILSLAASAHAQLQSASGMRFEVASVRASTLPDGDIAVSLMAEESARPCRRAMLKISGTLVSLNGSVCDFLRLAYDIEPERIFGTPVPTVNTKPKDYFYQIEARVSGPDTPSTETVQAMLKTLLAERFGLKVHWEERNLSYVALVPSKSGTKLIAATDSCKPHPSSGLISLCGQTMEQIATFLGAYARQRVVNMTTLSGKFDIEIPYDINAGLDLRSAVLSSAQERLGLRLESRNGASPVLLIDHLEAPSAN